MNGNTTQAKKLALVSIFSALAVVIAPIAYFDFVGTKAYPTQHTVNALLGVLVGPFWAAVAAVIIGVIRIALGIGSVYAFPGGIPGGVIVGVGYLLLKRLTQNEKIRSASALTEPIGTVLVGATLSLCLIAPWIQTQPILDKLSEHGPLLAYLVFSSGWVISSVPGCILGFSILVILNRVGINRKTLFGEE